jgi:RND superfamily putative drug exporter
MATLLFRLGRFAYRHALQVLAAWVLIAAAALGAGLGLGGQLQDSYAIPGTESQSSRRRRAAARRSSCRT